MYAIRSYYELLHLVQGLVVLHAAEFAQKLLLLGVDLLRDFDLDLDQKVAVHPARYVGQSEAAQLENLTGLGPLGDVHGGGTVQGGDLDRNNFV